MTISSVSADLSWKFCAVRRSVITPPPLTYFLRSNFVPKFTYYFPTCSILFNNSTTPYLHNKSIINSTSNTCFSICDLSEFDIHHSYHNLRRLLESSILVFAVMLMSLFFTQHPAFAASYGRIGGSSSRSSSSSSRSRSSSSRSCSRSSSLRSSSSNFSSSWSSRSSRPSRYIKYINSDDSDYVYNSTCSVCKCFQGKRKTCTNCNCFKQKERELNSSDVNDGINLLTSNCNCKCHSPCKCMCHSATVKVIMFIFFVIAAIAEIAEINRQDALSEDTNEDNVQKFDYKIEVADIRRGSVLMVQVGILDKKRELQRKLYRIAQIADTYTISGLNNLKQEVVKALLEHHDSCHFAYLFAKYDDMEKYSRPCFSGFLETELAKFNREEETFANIDGVICKKDFAGNVNNIDNEYSVVTLLVLADGEHWIPSVKWHTPHVSKVDVKTALQRIRSIRKSDLEAVEVLWTPQTENDSISEQELRRDFGLLMRPVKLIKKYSLLSWF